MRQFILVVVATIGFGKCIAFLLFLDAILSIHWSTDAAQLAVSVQALVCGVALIYASSSSRLPRLVRGFGIYAAVVGIGYSVMPAAMWASSIGLTLAIISAHPIVPVASSALISAALLWSASTPRPPEQSGPAISAAMSA